MNLTIFTSRHSKASAVALGEALDCNVFNPHQNSWYRQPERQNIEYIYNMGCSNLPLYPSFNAEHQVSVCVNKIATLDKLQEAGVLTVPWTRNPNQAQQWLDEDRIIVNRLSITGKANEGLIYSYKELEEVEDVPLDPSAIIWTRYVNHTRELRAYCIKGHPPLVFHKKDDGTGQWKFIKITPNKKLMDQLLKAELAFDKMFLIAFDILECVTGDYYFLEANSAPSLLAHESILPVVAKAVKQKVLSLQSVS